MSNTYLIFFGKSQNFSFHVFDSNGYIDNFNNIIKDFDELESKVFTVDDVSNSELLSKYIFNENGKMYSLLKLYSLAQAYSGNRIAGSIYGVALLSDQDIKLSETNLSILSAAKSSFAQSSLDGKKFKSSDFYTEVDKVWRALINYKGKNLLEAIEYNNFKKLSVNNNIKAFYVKDILKSPIALNSEITQTSRLYFSDDLAHLKRTQERRGKQIFPFYQLENGKYILYKEEIPESKSKTKKTPSSDKLTHLQLENGELKRENIELDKKLRHIRRQLTKKFRIASIIAVVLGLTTLTFFFTDLFSNSEKDTNDIPVSDEIQYIAEEGNQNTTPKQENIVDLNNILGDDNSRNILSILLQNIKQYPNSKDKQKYYDAIIRDAKILNLDISQFDNFKPIEKVKTILEPQKPKVEKVNSTPKNEPKKTEVNKQKIEKEPEKKQEKNTITTKKEDKKQELKKNDTPKEDSKEIEENTNKEPPVTEPQKENKQE